MERGKKFEYEFKYVRGSGIYRGNFKIKKFEQQL